MATLEQVSKSLTKFVYGTLPPDAVIRIYARDNVLEVYGMNRGDCWLIAEFTGHWHACRVIDLEIDWGDLITEQLDDYIGYEGRVLPVDPGTGNGLEGAGR